jgi:hypothetical protein
MGPLRTASEKTMRPWPFTFRRSAFSVQRSAFSVQRSPFAAANRNDSSLPAQNPGVSGIVTSRGLATGELVTAIPTPASIDHIQAKVAVR